jgi:SAM-dependent methyltransferase
MTTLTDLAEAYRGHNFTPSPSCPICRSPSKVVHEATNINPEKPFRFDFRVCSRCAHGWIDPMPAAGLLSYLYERGSLSVISAGWKEKVPCLTQPERVVLEQELDRPTSTPANYFELGIGKGLLYERFLDRGWNCTGVDLGGWGRTLPNVHGNLDDVPASLRAEVIVALDVLEHVPDPVSILRILRTFAAPGARLYCAMPNRESFRARVHGSRWRMVRPMGHVNYYSRKSIAAAFAAAGFAVTRATATDLWVPHRIRSARHAVQAAVELLGLGDQWMVTAEAGNPAERDTFAANGRH